MGLKLQTAMFADNNNQFYLNNNILNLFLTVTMKKELKKNIVKWFNTNKISLNLGKTFSQVIRKGLHTTSFVTFKHRRGYN